MKTVTLDVHSPGKAMAGFVTAWRTGTAERSGRIAFAPPELLWQILAAKRWERLKVCCGVGPVPIREAARRQASVGACAYDFTMVNARSAARSAQDAGTAGDEGEEPAVRVLRRFRLVFNAVKTHFQQVEKKAGVGGAQLWALSLIRSGAGIGVSDLARAMDVHQSTASNLVRTLAERELIEVSKDGPDRRTVQLRILPAGSRVLRRAPGPFAGVLPQALAGLDPQTLARLDADLATLISALDADERAANIPLGQ